MSIGIGNRIGRRAGGVRATTGIIPVVTTGAQTVTFERLDVAAGETLTIDWGDTTSDVYTDANNGATKTHLYAGAGTYEVKVSDARVLTEVNLNNALIVGFNSSFFKSCGDNLASVRLSSALVTPTINSADMAHLKLSGQLILFRTTAGTYTINSDHFKAYTLNSQLVLLFTQAGTYTIDSDHFKAYTLSSELVLWFDQVGTYTIDSDDFKAYTLSSALQLYFTQAGTYTIDSDHFKAYTLSSELVLLFTQAGTYTIDSDHFKAYTLSFRLYLRFDQVGTYTIDSDHFKAYTLSFRLILFFTQAGTYNIARADITFVRVPTVTINIPSLATSTDDILLGFYDRLPDKTNNGGTINLTGSPAPTGVYEANADCGTDPNGGKGAAYELINDSCERATAPHPSTKRWASVTVEGGGTP